MKKHLKLNCLVIKSLKKYKSNGINPTARHLFEDIKRENPTIIKKGFKSFVKIINFLPCIKSNNNLYIDYKTYSEKLK